MRFDDDEHPSNRTLEIARPSRECSFLVEIQDDDGTRVYPLPRKRLVVGTARDADLTVRDATVSKQHCVLDVLGHGISIEDRGSRNGTYVGSARIMQAWATAGTTVILGRATLSFLEVPEAPDEVPFDVAPLSGLAGGSSAMRRIAAQVRELSQHAAPVLITGETGTGKELIARALHDEGPRAREPFVVVNVASLPRELVESEMFGHERGAFTGAVARRSGAFVEADGGTLFLDEIGDLPLDAQPKLLRALDGYEVKRVGGTGSGQRYDVRLVAATHVDLENHVAGGKFRRDLFHRLEVFVVELPPLRARRGDIAAIARELLRKQGSRRELTSAAVARLTAHDWPGNVRELRNVLIRAACLTTAPQIDVPAIERGLRDKAPPGKVATTPPLAKTLFAQHHGNLTAAARAAGIPRTTFRKLLNK